MNIFLSNFESETEINEAQVNVFIVATTTIYTAKSLSIDSGLMQEFNKKEYSEILDIPSSLVPTILVLMGYPTDK